MPPLHRHVHSPSGGIWISDALLQRTFERFLRRIAGPHHQHSRHGSNVPGPLEAQKRLARRRLMGLSTASPSSSSPAALANDPSLWLSWPPRRVEQDVTYLPPTLQPGGWDFPGLSPPPPPPPPFAIEAEVETPDDVVEEVQAQVETKDIGGPFARCRTVEDVRAVLAGESLRIDEAVRAKRAAFQHLCSLVTIEKNQDAVDAVEEFLVDVNLNTAGGANLKNFVNQLQSLGLYERYHARVMSVTLKMLELDLVRDAQSAYLLLRSINALSAQSESRKHDSLEHIIRAFVDGMQSSSNQRNTAQRKRLLVALIDSVVELPASTSSASLMARIYQQSLRSNIPGRVHRFVTFLKRAVDAHSAPAFLEFLRTALSQEEVLAITSHLAVEQSRAQLLTPWLRFLRTSHALGSEPATSKIWQLLFEQVAPQLQLKHVSELVSSFSEKEAASVLFRYWISPHLKSSQGSAYRRHKPTTLVGHGHRTVDGALYDILEFLKHDKSSPSHSARNQEIVKLLMALPASTKASPDVQVVMFQLLNAVETPQAIVELVHSLHRNERIAIHPAVAAQLINAWLPHTPIQSANLFRLSPRTTFRLCPDLPIRVIQTCPRVTSTEILTWLARPDSDNSVPVANRLTRRHTLTPARTTLIHSIATAWSHSPHLRPRQAFRNIWHLYRYLSDREVPLQPSLSRAFVRAGILRPLLARRTLSHQQETWILSLVSRIEGPSIAEDLELLIANLKSELARLDGGSSDAVATRRRIAALHNAALATNAATERHRLLAPSLSQVEADANDANASPRSTTRGYRDGRWSFRAAKRWHRDVVMPRRRAAWAMREPKADGKD